MLKVAVGMGGGSGADNWKGIQAGRSDHVGHGPALRQALLHMFLSSGAGWPLPCGPHVLCVLKLCVWGHSQCKAACAHCKCLCVSPKCVVAVGARVPTVCGWCVFLCGHALPGVCVHVQGHRVQQCMTALPHGIACNVCCTAQQLGVCVMHVGNCCWHGGLWS